MLEHPILLKYNGIIYKANWWTTTTPGSDSSWSKK
ncbi:cellulose-binding domain-containing protein [Clostridium gasigenes]|nr:cellulose-binding domain-containing protein [Clostridium gasigenes]